MEVTEKDATEGGRTTKEEKAAFVTAAAHAPVVYPVRNFLLSDIKNIIFQMFFP
jgi:hypothetical protein